MPPPHKPSGPLPIGSLHARDFAPMRTQRTLAEAPADSQGYVRFSCLNRDCSRTGKIRLAALQQRFAPGEGLVNILNAVMPKDCPRSAPDPWGSRRCGFCYRDLR
ncbi:hypothetical protein [Phenylobacterium sp.]|uniref:hypothetical protein n=1 Tax=Phenylobacterium sp. TaxID=1871053 RepID=UPI002F4052A9